MNISHYDYTVSVTRVCAMFFIIICHLGSFFGSDLVGQFFNVGVPIFFLISGYLYGDKKIRNLNRWIKMRLIRLYIPLLIWGVVVTSFIIIRGEVLPSIKEYIFFLLNLHGLNFVFYNMPDLAMGPWFFSVIMLCYFFVVLYQLIERKHENIILIFYYGGIIPLCIQVVAAYLGVSVPLSFLVGYGLKKRGLLEKQRPYNLFVGIIVFIIAVFLRVVTKRYIDGTILYDHVIVELSHLMIASAFFIEIRWLFDIIGENMTEFASSSIIKWLDKISIYVYISHDWFVRDIFELHLPLLIRFIVYFTEVFIVASILYKCGNKATTLLVAKSMKSMTQ